MPGEEDEVFLRLVFLVIEHAHGVEEGHFLLFPVQSGDGLDVENVVLAVVGDMLLEFRPGELGEVLPFCDVLFRVDEERHHIIFFSDLLHRDRIGEEVCGVYDRVADAEDVSASGAGVFFRGDAVECPVAALDMEFLLNGLSWEYRLDGDSCPAGDLTEDSDGTTGVPRHVDESDRKARYSGYFFRLAVSDPHPLCADVFRVGVDDFFF